MDCYILNTVLEVLILLFIVTIIYYNHYYSLLLHNHIMQHTGQIKKYWDTKKFKKFKKFVSKIVHVVISMT